MNRIFPIIHDTFVQPVVSLIQCILHFSQYKIRPYSPLQVSMISLQKIFTSAPSHHPNTFSLSLIGDKAMATAFQAFSLVTRTHGSLSFPACSLSFQEFITSHAFATSRSLIILINPCSILLKLFSNTLLHFIYFITVLPCSYLVHFIQIT